MTGRHWTWVGGAVVSLAATGLLIAWLASEGLDRADKISGVAGLFVSLLALGAAVWQLWRSRPQGQQGYPNGPSEVGGSMSRINGVGGSVRIRRGAPRGLPGAAGPTPGPRIAGHYDDIEGVRRDVELTEEQ